ncbi:MAG: 50S ribosomal protein L23 [Candidatus Saccharimonas sp.]
MKLIIVTPRATEKAYRLVTAQNTYVFDVPLDVNKQEIRQAVESQFDKTKVSNVTTLIQKGKSIRFSRGKRSFPGTTHRKDSKRAYVTLSEGKIKVFDTEETKADKKAEKKAKKVEKKEEKK